VEARGLVATGAEKGILRKKTKRCMISWEITFNQVVCLIMENAMGAPNIIDRLGFYRIAHVSDRNNLSDDELSIVEQVKEFGIDFIYFCSDEKHSYPALFLKKITEFDKTALGHIADIQKKIWNYKKILFLYVYTDTEIRIYNCTKKPIIKTSEIDYTVALENIETAKAVISDGEALNDLCSLFSAIAIDSGVIWNSEKAIRTREEINIRTRVDNYLIGSLVRTARKLMTDGLDISLIHKLLLRSLFLLYLEDRGATDKSFYNEINTNASSYFAILDNVQDTYKLYEKLETHFNGSLFAITNEEASTVKTEHLQRIKKCFIYGDDGSNQPYLFNDWRIFDFKIIQVELLSEIYESFLEEIEPEKKYQTGTFYTPPALVEFILNKKLKADKEETQYNIKILDPACGSGIFLVESFKRLIKRYENASEKKLTDYETLKQLLLANIYGIDINPYSLKVAAFGLYLALLENLDPKTLWQSVELPCLIGDADLPEEKQGKNLYCLDAIKTNSQIESRNYDLVVGNPPFGASVKPSPISDYCRRNDFALEQVLPFLHKAPSFSPNGDIALIFNTKILTNNLRTYKNFRKWLLNSCYVESVYNFSILRKAPKNYGGQLFNASSSPICIIFYRKAAPEQFSSKIMYYVPKTYIKSNILDGIVIDSTDIKYLPRKECQRPDTKIWKIAMWGGEGDINLINKLSSKQFDSVKIFMKRYSIKSGVGFGLFSHDENQEPQVSTELAEMKYLDANRITRYYTPRNCLTNVTESLKRKETVSFYKKLYNATDVRFIRELKHFRRFGTMAAYKSPHVVVKKGLEKNKICASFLDFDGSFKDGVYGFYSENSDVLKVLTAYFNSRLSYYFILMTNSSYGIEREQIMKEEFLSIPISLNKEEMQRILLLVSTFLEKAKSEYPFTESEPSSAINKEIDNIIYKSLGLNERDIIILNDAIDCNFDLFQNKKLSTALRPIRDIQPYAKMICNELDSFLDAQDFYAGATLYSTKDNSPLVMIKLSFSDKKEEAIISNEDINSALEKIDKYLWKKERCNIYFRKKLNYDDGDNIYIIRPNQKRFWTQSAAINDAAEIILECLSGN
jgi:type I restriction-modification system DNA methylase subunit